MARPITTASGGTSQPAPVASAPMPDRLHDALQDADLADRHQQQHGAGGQHVGQDRDRAGDRHRRREVAPRITDLVAHRRGQLDADQRVAHHRETGRRLPGEAGDGRDLGLDAGGDGRRRRDQHQDDAGQAAHAADVVDPLADGGAADVGDGHEDQPAEGQRGDERLRGGQRVGARPRRRRRRRRRPCRPAAPGRRRGWWPSSTSRRGSRAPRRTAGGSTGRCRPRRDSGGSAPGPRSPRARRR